MYLEGTVFGNDDMFRTIFEMAQIVKGLPWLLPRANTSTPYLDSIKATSYAMDISHFSNLDVYMVLGDQSGNSVTFTYGFRDFRGAKVVPSGLNASLVTHCEAFGDNPVPLAAAYEVPDYGQYLWIFPRPYNESLVTPNTTIHICTFNIFLLT